MRWAWRLFRREWRQQILVLTLITVAVAATIFGAALGTNLPLPANAGFGSANALVNLPGNDPHLASEIAALVAVLRGADLKKPPSISETVDWARTLLALGAGELTDEMTRQTLSVLLKYERDITLALAELSLA